MPHARSNVGHIVEKGKALYQQVCAHDVEGVVAKPIISQSHDVARRSPWLRIKSKLLTASYSRKGGRTDLFNRKPLIKPI